VHFTPEHVLQYEWERTSNQGGTSDIAFGVSEDAIAKELLMIANQHRLILRVFDRCLDGQLYRDSDVKQIAHQAFEQYKDLLQREGFTAEAASVGDDW